MKMFFAFAILFLRFSTGLAEAINEEIERVPLPFNLPGSQLCTPCYFEAWDLVNWSAQVMGQMDVDCQVDKQGPDSQFHLLLEDFYENKIPFTYLLYDYFKAMQYYEDVFGSRYNFSVYVVSSGNLEFCVQLFYGGTGFLKPFNVSGLPKNKMKAYNDGRQHEIDFVSGLLEVWILSSNKCSKLVSDTIAVKNRVSTRKAIWTRTAKRLMKTEELGRPCRFNPLVEDRFIQNCSIDKNVIPIRLVSSVNACDGIICSVNIANKEHDNFIRKDYASTLRHPIAMSLMAGSQDDSTKRKSDTSSEGSKLYFINEINPFAKSRSAAIQFIEIKATPPPGGGRFKAKFPSMKIVVFTAYSLKMVRVFNLVQRQIPENGLFVLTSQEQGDKKVHIAGDFETESWLPSGDIEPCVVVLLGKTDNTDTKMWEKMDLNRLRGTSYRQTPMTPELLINMKLLILDGQIYGKQINKAISDNVLQLFPASYRTCNCILPVADPSVQTSQQSSLNLCATNAEASTFQFRLFKHGVPTPGNENRCDENTPFLCLPAIDNEFEVENQMESPTCPPEPNPLIGFVKARISSEIDYIKKNFNPSYEHKYYPIEKFGKTVWPTMKTNFQIQWSVQNLPDILPFEYVRQGDLTDDTRDVPYVTRYRCSICHTRLKSCPASMSSQQRGSKIAQADQIPTSSSRFYRRLTRHLESTMHHASILYNVQKDRNSYITDKQLRFETTPDPELKQLANVIDITYTIIKTNTAPSNSKVWYAALKKLNADVGDTMHSRQTAFAITKLIAETGTKDIFEYLVEKNEPFTLILDGSSDAINNHYVIVYLQALEGEVTTSYFAFLLKLRMRFNADAYLEELMKAVADVGPEFEAYFKRQIVGISTDSAKVMESFHDKLSNLIGRRTFDGRPVKLISLYCLAHRLQLATRTAFKPSKADKSITADSPIHYFSYLEKFMQNSYTWFRWSGRRIAVFRNVILEEKLPPVEFKELHVERWVSSEYSTVKNFVTAWTTARLSLQAIEDDTTIDAKSKTGIDAMQAQFNDKTALITIHFLWDFTAAFKVWSEHLQLLSGVLMDQFKYFQILQESLNTLADFKGTVLVKFLSECICSDRHVETIDEYEACEIIDWNNLQFERTKLDAPSFRSAAEALISKVKSRIDLYIPKNLLATIHALNPSNLPPNIHALNSQHPKLNAESEIRIYGEEEITELLNLLGMNPEQVLPEWAGLIDSMLNSPSWSSLRRIEDANMFWAAALREDLKWTENMRRFIKSFKVLAPGSVACETGFSIFNEVKSKKRNRINDNNLENIMKILINGPESIDKFDSYKYAERWVLAGHQKPQTSTTTAVSGNALNACDELNNEQVAPEIEEDEDNQDVDVSSEIADTEEDVQFIFPNDMDVTQLHYDDSYTMQFDKSAMDLRKTKDKNRFRSRIM